MVWWSSLSTALLMLGWLKPNYVKGVIPQRPYLMSIPPNADPVVRHLRAPEQGDPPRRLLGSSSNSPDAQQICTAFQSNLAALVAKLDHGQCAVCDHGQTDCGAYMQESCIPAGSTVDNPDQDVCFTSYIHETTDLTAEPPLYISQVAITYTHTPASSPTASPSSNQAAAPGFVVSVDGTYEAVTDCNLFWNGERCKSCNVSCELLLSDGSTQNGFALDCSNIQSDAVLSCVPDNDPRYVFSTRAIAFLSQMPAKPSLPPAPEVVTGQDYCNQFLSDIALISAPASKVGCPICVNSLVDCSADLQESCVPAGSTPDNPTQEVCFTSSVHVTTDLSMSPPKYISQVAVQYTRPLTTDVPSSSFGSDSSPPETFSFSVDGAFGASSDCSFIWNKVPCNSCSADCQVSAAQVDAPTSSPSFGGFSLDCSNVIPEAILDCVPQDVNYLIAPQVIAFLSNVSATAAASASPEPSTSLDFGNEETVQQYCQDFVADIAELAAPADQAACPVCANLEANCHAQVRETCLPPGLTPDNPDQAVCFTSSVHVTTDFATSPPHYISQVAVTYSSTNDDVNPENGFSFGVDGVFGQSSRCNFIWNNTSCISCDAGCHVASSSSSSSPGLGGFALNCSNIHPEAVLDCVPDDLHYLTAPRVMALLARLSLGSDSTRAPTAEPTPLASVVPDSSSAATSSDTNSNDGLGSSSSPPNTLLVSLLVPVSAVMLAMVAGYCLGRCGRRLWGLKKQPEHLVVLGRSSPLPLKQPFGPTQYTDNIHHQRHDDDDDEGGHHQNRRGHEAVFSVISAPDDGEEEDYPAGGARFT